MVYQCLVCLLFGLEIENKPYLVIEFVQQLVRQSTDFDHRVLEPVTSQYVRSRKRTPRRRENNGIVAHAIRAQIRRIAHALAPRLSCRGRRVKIERYAV